MPNGRSGGFPMQVSDLKRVLSAAADLAPIASLVDGSRSQELRPVAAHEILRLVEASVADSFPVEEQDHSFYVIHLSDRPSLVWVLVKSGSPMYSELARLHGQWKKDHPDWDGWIGY